jgi:competence protein ComEC
VPDVLSSLRVDRVLDRGKSYVSSYYDAYSKAVKDKRATATKGQKIILDQGTPNPVTIEVYAVNANSLDTTNENDLSLAASISYGAFRAEIGGDLSGDNTANYIDVETGVAPTVGKLDVYKAHHHCSSHSSIDDSLRVTKPTIAVISAWNGNSYSHPAEDCVERLHGVGTKTYWTEHGTGGTPVPG